MEADPAFSPGISAVTAASANPSPAGIFSELQQQPHPRRRRKTPKVKTGCLTCRSRRVKCDESKPICKKCEKLCFSCSYPILVEKPKQRPRQPITNLHPLVPKTRPSHPTPSRIYVMKPSPQFTDENEARYFVYYCEGMSKQIGGPFPNKLWDYLIPQAGEAVPFIRKAVIALGALSKSHSMVRGRDPHHSYALSQYVQALNGMRKSIAENQADVRTALIGCLLVFCFESLQSHQDAASLHASSGVDLITSLCTRCAPKSWKDSEIGAELYAAFSGLNLQSLLFLDQRTAERHRSYKDGLGKAAACMPGEFGDLGECRRFWHYLMRRNLHFALEVRDSLARLSPTSALLAERDQYVRDICRWETASAPLLCRLSTPSSSTPQNRNTETGKEEVEDFLVATLLRIHAAMNIILLTRAFNPPESAYDKFLDQFRTIVNLSERIHHLLVSSSGSFAEGGEGGVFRFEIGILPALSQVSLLCRDRDVRKRAIRLLQKSKGYKEGIWDAEGVWAVGLWGCGLGVLRKKG